MMKKTAVFIILSVLILTILSSCADLPTYVMYTGGERGTYYNLGNSISELFKENEDTKGDKDKTKFRADIQVRSSSGYKQNIDALSSGEATLAIVRNDIAYFALNGTGCYKGSMKKGFSAIAHLYLEAVYIVAGERITSVGMLSGRRIAVGEKGSANEAVSESLMAACGITEYEKVNLTVAGSVEAYKNGEIDALILISGVPSSTIKDLSASAKFNLLSLPDDVLADACEDNPYFVPCTVKKNNYSVLKGDLITVGLYATLLVSNSVDEDVVYNMTKRLAEDTFLLMHDKAEELLPETMWNNMCVPLHEGAEEYYDDYIKEQSKKTTAPEETSSPEDTEETDSEET